MSHDLTVFAVIPVGRADASVVDLDRLAGYLADGDPLDEAITNAGIDGFEQGKARAHLDLIRRLNATGDATAYWRDRDDL